MSEKKKLVIEIPEIDPDIFERRIIDGIPTLNKQIKCKSAYEFWNDSDENINKNTKKRKNNEK